MNKLHLIASGILMFAALQTNAQNKSVSPKILTDETAALVMEPGKDLSAWHLKELTGYGKTGPKGNTFPGCKKLRIQLLC